MFVLEGMMEGGTCRAGEARLATMMSLGRAGITQLLSCGRVDPFLHHAGTENSLCRAAGQTTVCYASIIVSPVTFDVDVVVIMRVCDRCRSSWSS